MKIPLTLTLCALAWLCGCAPTETVIPDPGTPHRIARKTTVTVWLRKGRTDTFQAVEVDFPPGWWILPPHWNKPVGD